ncbi:MAG: glycoside hydrolase family 3 C-terminal domain-containing protein [Chitinophagales bacterium]
MQLSNPNPEVSEQDIQSLISKLTLKEKAMLCSGLDNWHTKPIERLNIPSIMMTDGPHGLRREKGEGFGNSEKATCFPTAVALASTWNTDLIEEVGAAIGKECQAQGVQILLGPGANIKRSPLNGRNFEYYSEDPILSGKIAAAFIKGVQSQGVGTSLKHFAVNNQEFERMSINVKVSERALREIYLRGFEIAVKEAQPTTLMCAYNRINGIFAAEHRYLLHEILKKEWGFKGFVVSDWGAVHDRVEGIKAGLQLEMPGNAGINDVKIIEAVRNGTLEEKRLDEVVADLLGIILKLAAQRKTDATFDAKEHHELARKTAAEGIVLLKNEGGILPLSKKCFKSIAVIGDFAENPRFQGGGSSRVNPTQLDIPFNELYQNLKIGMSLSFSNGYPNEDVMDEQLIQDAVKTAQYADIAIVFAGLPNSYETEGADRQHLQMPPNHNRLIQAVAAAQANTIVVLQNGSAIAMPWLNEVKGVVESWLGGQAGGSAVADVLFGQVNPSGKLTETFPQRLEDTPAFLNYPGENRQVTYGEGLFVGYRYYDKKKITPLFPFGFGLSYTEFQYGELELSHTKMSNTDTLEVKLNVENIGDYAGQEVVQLYVKDHESPLQRPEKELKAFTKVALEVGETKTVTLTLNWRDFAFYDDRKKAWATESGKFDILIGSSSNDIRLRESLQFKSTQALPPMFDLHTTFKELLAHPKAAPRVQPIMDGLMNFMFMDAEFPDGESKADALAFGQAIVLDLPLIKMVGFSSGKFSMELIEGLLKEVN